MEKQRDGEIKRRMSRYGHGWMEEKMDGRGGWKRRMEEEDGREDGWMKRWMDGKKDE